MEYREPDDDDGRAYHLYMLVVFLVFSLGPLLARLGPFAGPLTAQSLLVLVPTLVYLSRPVPPGCAAARSGTPPTRTGNPLSATVETACQHQPPESRLPLAAPSAVQVFLALVAGLLAWPAAALLAAGYYRLPGITAPGPAYPAPPITDPAELARALFSLALAPAVAEETLFRGYIQSALLREAGAGRPLALFLHSGLLFGFYHLSLARLLPAAGLGFLYSSLVFYTGSLWTGILAHFATNAAALIVPSLVAGAPAGEPSLPVPAGIAVPSALVAILAVAFLARSTKKGGRPPRSPLGECCPDPGGRGKTVPRPLQAVLILFTLAAIVETLLLTRFLPPRPLF